MGGVVFLLLGIVPNFQSINAEFYDMLVYVSRHLASGDDLHSLEHHHSCLFWSFCLQAALK